MAVEPRQALPLLGSLPETWNVGKFGTIIDGGTRNGIYKSKQYHGHGAKIVNMGELFGNPRLGPIEMSRIEVTNDELRRFGVDPGDLLFARRSLVAEGAGKCSVVLRTDEPTVFESSIIRARPDVRLADSLFLYYVFSSPFGRYSLGTILRQVAVSGITGRDLVDVELPLPPLAEQRAIAHILATLDDKIELNRRMNETLEAVARAIFKSWFVDFDPVRAKAEGRDTGLPRHIADLFPDRFEPSELGEIPAGWEATSLGRLATVDRGLSYKGKFLADDSGHLMINLGCFIGHGKFAAERIKRYTGDFKERHLVTPGDLVVANTDMTQKRVVLGSPAIVPDLFDEAELLFTHHVFALRFSRETRRWRGYVYFALLRPEFREIAEGYATGTTVLALPKDGLLNYPVCLPGEAVREQFDAMVGRLLDRKRCTIIESGALAELRDVLLPKLISGEVRVKDAERFTKEVV